jgi:hypothetical protein
MHHAPYREMLEAAALDLLEEDERRVFDEHLNVCQSCEADLIACRETIALLLYAVEPVEPPSFLRARLQESIRLP